MRSSYELSLQAPYVCMLVVSVMVAVLPEGPADGSLEPGDVLLAVDGHMRSDLSEMYIPLITTYIISTMLPCEAVTPLVDGGSAARGSCGRFPGAGGCAPRGQRPHVLGLRGAGGLPRRSRRPTRPTQATAGRKGPKKNTSRAEKNTSVLSMRTWPSQQASSGRVMGDVD
jgi:hypothetical protein